MLPIPLLLGVPTEGQETILDIDESNNLSAHAAVSSPHNEAGKRNYQPTTLRLTLHFHRTSSFTLACHLCHNIHLAP